MCLSFSRLGSAVNFDLSPLFVDHFGGAGNGGFSAAMYMGTVACLISLLCTIVLNFMDYRAERMRARSAMSKSQSEANLEEQPVRLSDVATFPVSVWLIFLITIAFYSSVFVFLQNGVQFLEQQYGYQVCLPDPRSMHTDMESSTQHSLGQSYRSVVATECMSVLQHALGLSQRRVQC